MCWKARVFKKSNPRQSDMKSPGVQRGTTLTVLCTKAYE